MAGESGTTGRPFVQGHLTANDLQPHPAVQGVQGPPARDSNDLRETYLKVAGQWVYLYRAVDQHGQVIDVLASLKRDLAATRQFFARALNAARRPTEVITGRAPAYPRVLDELVPEAWHVVEQYANNPIEADHGRLKARTRPMRGLKRLRCAQVVCSGHAFVQNLRRGHYELGLDTEPGRRLEVVFTELALAI